MNRFLCESKPIRCSLSVQKFFELLKKTKLALAHLILDFETYFFDQVYLKCGLFSVLPLEKRIEKIAEIEDLLSFLQVSIK